MKLQLYNICYKYNNSKVLSNINFSIKDGIYAISGFNNSGKTTMANLIAGRLRPTDGFLLLNDYKIIGRNKKDIIVKNEILYKNPEEQIFKDTLYEDFLFSIRYNGLIDKEKMKKNYNSLLYYFGIDIIYKDRYYKNLTKRIVKLLSVCKIMALDSEIIILDEPFEGLRKSDSIKVVDKLKEITEKKERMVIIFSKNFEYLCGNCLKYAILNNCEVKFYNDLNELIEDYEFDNVEFMVPQKQILLYSLRKKHIDIGSLGDIKKIKLYLE